MARMVEIPLENPWKSHFGDSKFQGALDADHRLRELLTEKSLDH